MFGARNLLSPNTTLPPPTTTTHTQLPDTFDDNCTTLASLSTLADLNATRLAAVAAAWRNASIPVEAYYLESHPSESHPQGGDEGSTDLPWQISERLATQPRQRRGGLRFTPPHTHTPATTAVDNRPPPRPPPSPPCRSLAPPAADYGFLTTTGAGGGLGGAYAGAGKMTAQFALEAHPGRGLGAASAGAFGGSIGRAARVPFSSFEPGLILSFSGQLSAASSLQPAFTYQGELVLNSLAVAAPPACTVTLFANATVAAACAAFAATPADWSGATGGFAVVNLINGAGGHVGGASLLLAATASKFSKSYGSARLADVAPWQACC